MEHRGGREKKKALLPFHHPSAASPGLSYGLNENYAVSCMKLLLIIICICGSLAKGT